jgi:hypothetical protein
MYYTPIAHPGRQSPQSPAIGIGLDDTKLRVCLRQKDFANPQVGSPGPKASNAPISCPVGKAMDHVGFMGYHLLAFTSH